MEPYKVENLIGHPLTEKPTATAKVERAPSGINLRLDIIEERAGFTDSGIPIIQRTQVVDLSRLPPEIPGVLYIVSNKIIDSLTLEKIGRRDFICIDSERDMDGEYGAEFYGSESGDLAGKVKSLRRYRLPTKTIIKK